MIMQKLISEAKKTVVFLGEASRGVPRFYATGFLVGVEKILHLVTAKHVVIDRKSGKIEDSRLRIFYNSKEKGIDFISIEALKRQTGINWIFHSSKEVDIAIIPFALDPQKGDFRMIPDDLFLSLDSLLELYEVFSLSYQPGIEPKGKISPIFRNGTISIINEDRTFYIDAPAFPGNSGSPVFLKPSAIRFEEKGISIGGDQLGGKFVGVIGEYIPYSEVAISAQSGRPRIIFEENTGLSRVWSVVFINEIIESDAFKEQLAKVLEITEKARAKASSKSASVARLE
jgi:hypothetical protein